MAGDKNFMSVNAKIAGYLYKADVSRGFFPEKVMKTVVRGDFTKEALDAIVAILTSRNLSQEQMEWGISRLPNITPEAASILLRSWFDGGKWKMEWEDRNLKNWIKVQLITKLGSKQEKRIADKIAVDFEQVRIRRIASRVIAYEFPTQDALEEYLKQHPKADKARHWVKKEERKPEEKKVPAEKKPAEKKPAEKTKEEPGAKGKFKIPEHKSLKYETSGDLSNLDKWKAKIVLGNSMAGEHKKGDMDEVGYVAINPKTDEIIPIARSDEHQAGYELLHHLHHKKVIKSKPEDFITLFLGNNYPDYAVSEKETGKYVDAVKKWLSYGGENSPIVKTINPCITDMEEYVKLNGKLPNKPKEPMKPAREILDLVEGLKKDLEEKSEDAFDRASKLAKKMKDFSFQVVYSYDDFEKARARVKEAVEAKDIKALAEPFSVMVDQLVQTAKNDSSKDRFKSMFGFNGESEKRLDNLVAKKPEKKTEKPARGLKEHAKESVGLFEKAAKDGAEVVQGTPNADKKLFHSAKSLMTHLQTGKLGMKPLDDLLDKVKAAIDEEAIGAVVDLLFSFKGIKNFLHMYLRELKERKQEDDAYFGNVNDALQEFDRLGQI